MKMTVRETELLRCGLFVTAGPPRRRGLRGTVNSGSASVSAKSDSEKVHQTNKRKLEQSE